MSLVTLNDRLAVLRMIENGNGPLSRRDLMLFSLANRDTWTAPQRQLVERLLAERAAHHARRATAHAVS